jgi:pyruvate dehydrogenase E1 component alpha subunit
MAQTKKHTTTESKQTSHEHALLEQMLLIRRFEEKSAEMYQAGKIRGFLHLYIGEEAVAVGAMQALQPDDAVVATYRDHGHALARGFAPSSLMAEMFGKATGSSRGRGGSMHLFDVAKRFYGGYAIVGGGLPIALGLALADKMRGRQCVTACFFGEGAAAEGEFHESMNLAGLWGLPVLFLCENNLYAMGTALELSETVTCMADKARSYRIPAETVDGMDVLAVEAATRKAADAVRRGDGPQFVEFQTYRFRAHSMSDPDLYRTKEEIERWKQRDPIATFTARLRADGQLSEEDSRRIEGRVAIAIDEAVRFADSSPWEPLDDLLKFVMTD